MASRVSHTETFRSSDETRHLSTSILDLSPGEKRFRPELAVQVLSKISNTMVLLLSDQGLKSSERVIQGYAYVWRLFVAVCERYPRVSQNIRSRLERFVRHPKSREKSKEPSLGHLLPLLAVCPNVHWIGAFSRAYMNESFDRAVLWIGRDNPELVTDMSRLKIGTGADYDRLDKTFKTRRVALRYTAIHIALSSAMKSPSIKNSCAALDYALGQAPRCTVRSLRLRLNRILQDSDSWPKMLREMNMMRIPTASVLTDMLKGSVRNSMRKSYHSSTTDFSSIHRGGSSRILLRGDTMVLPAGGSKIRIVDVWRWEHGAVQKYFDTTVFFFDFQGDHLKPWITHIHECLGRLRHIVEIS